MNFKIMCLREKLKALNIQGMIVSNPINIKYLTNIEAEGTLLITRKENIYITDGRYIEYANHQLTIEDEIIVSDMNSFIKDDYENFFMFCENVGFEEKYVTYEQYKKIQQLYQCNNLVETENVIEKLRIVKEEEEIENVKKACEITDQCFKHLINFIKKGMTEKEIALEIEIFFKQNGAEDVSFKPIVASGSNSSKPHATPTDRKIESGDVITIDMGCKYNGYCSDMTRTIFVDTIQEDVKRIYDLVLRNQKRVLTELRDGKNIKDICKIVESEFQLYNYELVHALGHGIGLDEHEIPVVSLKNAQNIKENSVLAIEPGIYIYGQFGVRIEDTVLITKNGCITLTNSEKNYIII